MKGETFLSMKGFGKSLNDKGYEMKPSNGKRWRIGIKLLNKSKDFDRVPDYSAVRTEEELEKMCAEL